MGAYLRLCFHNVGVTPSILEFGLRVPKCSAYRKSAWEHSDGSNNILWLLCLVGSFLGRLVVQGLCSCCLVYLTPCFYDSAVLINIRGLVVPAKGHYLLATVRRQNGPTVPNVCRVADLSDYQHNYSTGARSLNNSDLTRALIFCLANLKKSGFSLSKTTLDCLLRVPWKSFFFDNIVVEVVSQKFRTGATAMAIIDPEKGTGWPSLMLTMLGLHNVEDDRDSVFVVVAHKALVCIGSICANNAIAFIAALSWLMVRDYNPGAWC